MMFEIQWWMSKGGGARCRIMVLEDLWNVTVSSWKQNIQSGIAAILTCLFLNVWNKTLKRIENRHGSICGPWGSP